VIRWANLLAPAGVHEDDVERILNGEKKVNTPLT
jgi:hypothetical protein